MSIDETYELLKHAHRVSDLAYTMAKKFELDEHECREIAIAASLHDIGKFLLDPQVLNKKGKLTAVEMNQIKQHVNYSYKIGVMILPHLNSNVLKMVHEHHENYDGTGYPNAKSRDNLAFGSQIIRVCDSYDAMRSVRPYRSPLSKWEAFEMIRSGAEYNPLCVEKLKIIENINETAEAV